MYLCFIAASVDFWVGVDGLGGATSARGVCTGVDGSAGADSAGGISLRMCGR